MVSCVESHKIPSCATTGLSEMPSCATKGLPQRANRAANDRDTPEQTDEGRSRQRPNAMTKKTDVVKFHGLHIQVAVSPLFKIFESQLDLKPSPIGLPLQSSAVQFA